MKAYLVTQNANLLEGTGEDSCDIYAGTVYLPHEGIAISGYSVNAEGPSGTMELVNANSSLGDRIVIGDLARGTTPNGLFGKLTIIDIPDPTVKGIRRLLDERVSLEKSIARQAGIILGSAIGKS